MVNMASACPEMAVFGLVAWEGAPVIASVAVLSFHDLEFTGECVCIIDVD